MIAGLVSLARERQLLAPADLDGATAAVSAEALAPLDSAEITARLAALSSRLNLVVVFDGPIRMTTSRLQDGIARRRVMKAVMETGIPVISAPGLAAAQIAYMYQKQFITHAADCDEVFLFGDVPLLVDLFASTEETEPRVLHRRTLLASLQIPEQVFFQAAIGAGSAAHKPFVNSHESGISGLETAISTAVFSGDGSFSTAVLRLTPNLHLELLKTITFIARQPIMLTDGTVVLSNKYNQVVPHDIVDVVGKQLPPEVFWYLNRGILGPELPEAAAWSSFTDYYSSDAVTSSLDADSISQLQRAEELLRPIRQQTYSMFVGKLHRYFQSRAVENESLGGTTFTRMSPKLPDFAQLAKDPSPKAVARAAADLVRSAIDPTNSFKQVSDLELPEQFLRTALTKGDLEPLAVAKVQLALRMYMEVVVCNLFMRDVIPRSMDTRALVLAMPWC